MLMILHSDLDQHNPELVTNIYSIKQHILNILTTKKKSLIFHSDFGANIDDYLFEIMDDETAFGLLNEVVTAIERFEPRVLVDNSKTKVIQEPETHTMWVELWFTVKETDELHNFNIGFTK